MAPTDRPDRIRPERIGLSGFITAWSRPDTQAGLKAMLARIGK